MTKRKRVTTRPPSGNGRTQQHQKAECDINNIVAKAEKTGIINRINKEARYGDFSNGLEYSEMMERISHAKEDFMSLPSNIRARFKNSPRQLIDFLNDPENKAEAQELGIIATPVPENVNVPLNGSSEPPEDAPEEPEPITN